MKKIIFQSFIALTILQSIGVNAQLTVKGSNAFVYIGDEVLFVNQNVNLDQGKILLRREGQLLQGGVGTVSNSGLRNSSDPIDAGSLSAFILSRPTNQYSYTHFGIPVSTIGNAGFNPGANSIGGASAVTGYTPSNIITGRDGLAANGGSLSLSQLFISWYGGSANGAYSEWKYPIAQPTPTSNATVPKGYGLYIKGTTGSDATDAGEATANKVAGSTAQRMNFIGVPNDGTITMPIAAGTLYNIGNPYPSSLNINRFMYDNRDVIDAVYYYVETSKDTHLLQIYNYGYATYTVSNTTTLNPEGTGGVITMPTTLYRSTNNEATDYTETTVAPVSVNFTTPFVAIGTGFWVQTKAAPITGPLNLVFNNQQRAYTKGTENQNLNLNNLSGLARAPKTQDYGYFPEIINMRGIDYSKISKEPNPIVSFVANAKNDSQSISLVFSDNASESYMHLSDIVSDLSNEDNLKVYVEGKDNKYKLKTQKFDVTKKIPLTFESKSEQIVTMNMANAINYKLSDNIYIYDDYTGIYKDVFENTVSLDLPQGKTQNRYFLTFSKDHSSLADNTIINNAFIVLQNNKARELTINNPEGLNVTSTELYDIQGRLVLGKKNLGSEAEFRFPTSNLADGIYIVKIGTTNGKSVSKKVVVKN